MPEAAVDKDRNHPSGEDYVWLDRVLVNLKWKVHAVAVAKRVQSAAKAHLRAGVGASYGAHDARPLR